MKTEDYGERAGALLLMLAGACYLLRSNAFFGGVPGDLGDARFNSVVLEHLFQWVTGDARSLWTPPFFYPAQGTLAFSDNHFGSGAIYVLFRLVGLDREHALDGWLIVGSGLNLLAMYAVMRRLEFSVFPAAAAAFIYTFALPALAQEGHAQLTYRFAIPLAYLALVRFFRERSMVCLSQIAAWGAIQFYCSIYLGVFMGYLLAAASVAMAFPALRPSPVASPPKPARAPDGVAGPLVVILLSATATCWLLLQYQTVSRFYEFTRSPEDVLAMLPRPQSYLLADGVHGYSWLSELARGLPMSHEHQMFFGFAPILLGLWALLGARNEAMGARRKLLLHSLATLLLLVALTLYASGASFYQLLLSLPGVSSMRAVTRIVLVMIVPVAIMAAIGLENLQRRRSTRWLVTALAVLALSAETLSYVPAFATVAQWRERLAALEKLAEGAKFQSDSVLYVTGHSQEPFYLTELDGMVFAQDRKLPTLNGYSGNAPPGYTWPNPCNSPVVRISSLADSAFPSGGPTRADLLARTVWLAAEECPAVQKPTSAAIRAPLSQTRAFVTP